MWMENGSGGFFSDLVFEGGIYGLWVGNQQFTSRNITISGTSQAAIYVNWDWVCSPSLLVTIFSNNNKKRLEDNTLHLFFRSLLLALAYIF
jgi:hypothetical protein